MGKRAEARFEPYIDHFYRAQRRISILCHEESGEDHKLKILHIERF